MSGPQPDFDFHHLFQSCRVPVSIHDLAPLYEEFARLRAAGIDDLILHLQETPREVHRLFPLIRVMDANPAAVRFYEARDRDHLLKNLGETVDIPKLAVALVSIWLEEECFDVQATHTSLLGRKRPVRVSGPIPGQDAPNMIIPVTVVELQTP